MAFAREGVPMVVCQVLRYRAAWCEQIEGNEEGVSDREREITERNRTIESGKGSRVVLCK